MGRWQTPAWTSFRSQRRDAPWAGRWSRSRCHHRRSGRWGSPGDQCTDRTVSWCGQGPGRRSPYRWCSDHGRSCWRHPPYRWSAARGGTAGGRCQYGPHLLREIKYLDLWINIIIVVFERKMSCLLLMRGFNLIFWKCTTNTIPQFGYTLNF